MKKQNGLLIVIDGVDGSGKTTQYNLLKTHLKNEDIAHECFDFPQYGQSSAYFVEQYLNGAYGSLNQVSARQASLFYALDRFAASSAIRTALHEQKVVLCNRFTASNKAYQGAKVANARQRQDLFDWLDDLEHTMLAIPRPTLNIILKVPATLGQHNVLQKDVAQRSYIKQGHDLHEADATFLQRSIAVYDELCQLYPHDFVQVDCMQDKTRMQPAHTIHQTIWDIVQKNLR